VSIEIISFVFYFIFTSALHLGTAQGQGRMTKSLLYL